MLKRLLLVLVVGALGAAVVAPAAHAAFGIEKWESITCKENVDTPALGGELEGEPFPPQSPGQCKGATTPEKLFTQAAGHPNFGITDFTLNTLAIAGAGGFPDGFVKDIVVDTPEGLSVNPEAVPQCPIAEIKTPPYTCNPETIVGINYLTVAAEAPPCTVPAFLGNCKQIRAAVPVYNVEPFEGVPSMVGFPTKTGPTFIVGSLSPVDQHVTFTISDIHPPSPGPPPSPPIVGSRLVFFGNKGLGGKGGAYLTMPSNCAGGQVSKLTVESQGPPIETTAFSEASYTTPTGATGCANVPF